MIILNPEVPLKNEVFTEIAFFVLLSNLSHQILVLLFHRKSGAFSFYLGLSRIYVVGAFNIYNIINS